MNKQKSILKQRQRRKFRIRKRVQGTSAQPRLSITRSHRNISCQLIDDASGRTLVAASTRDESLRDQFAYGGNCQAAAQLGTIVAQKALEAGVKSVCFDRGCCKYHGRLAALADAAREAGLQF